MANTVEESNDGLGEAEGQKFTDVAAFPIFCTADIPTTVHFASPEFDLLKSDVC